MLLGIHPTVVDRGFLAFVFGGLAPLDFMSGDPVLAMDFNSAVLREAPRPTVGKHVHVPSRSIASAFLFLFCFLFTFRSVWQTCIARLK